MIYLEGVPKDSIDWRLYDSLYDISFNSLANSLKTKSLKADVRIDPSSIIANIVMIYYRNPSNILKEICGSRQKPEILVNNQINSSYICQKLNIRYTPITL